MKNYLYFYLLNLSTFLFFIGSLFEKIFKYIQSISGTEWWPLPEMEALGRLGQEGRKSKVSLGYKVRSYFKIIE